MRTKLAGGENRREPSLVAPLARGLQASFGSPTRTRRAARSTNGRK